MISGSAIEAERTRRQDGAMPMIQRLSFIGLEYAFAPEKAYGMSRGGGYRRQGGLVEVETDQGVTRHRRGLRQSLRDARIFPHGRADVRRQERVRLRPCRGPGPQRDVSPGRRQPAHRLPGRHQRRAVRRHRARLRRAGLRPDRRLRHDAHPGLCLDRLLLRRSRPPARRTCWPRRRAIPMPAPRSRSAAASGATSSGCARRARRWARTSC